MNIKHPEFEGKLSIVTSYITLPLLAQYTLPAGIFRAGPQFGFLSIKGVTASKDDVLKQATDAIKNDLNLNKFDLGLALGAGYHFNDRWNANLLYTQDLSKVAKDIKEFTKNYQFQVGVGYTF